MTDSTLRRRCLSQGVLERISKIIGNTSDGLTGSEIGYFLSNCGLTDTDPSITKWKRLYNAFVYYQNDAHCSNLILRFIQTVVHPSRYTDEYAFESIRKHINEALAYSGYELQNNGKFRDIPQVSTISEAQQRANNLLDTLRCRGAHSEIFKYCTAELVDENYFHAVFEA